MPATTTISTGFMTDVGIGEQLPVSSSTTAQKNAFRAFVSNLLFVETIGGDLVSESVPSSAPKEKEKEKKKREEEKEWVRVALLGHVTQEGKGNAAPSVMTLASVVFPPPAQMPEAQALPSSSSSTSSSNAAPTKRSAAGEKKRRREEAAEEKKQSDEQPVVVQEIAWRSLPLRSPLVFRHTAPAAAEGSDNKKEEHHKRDHSSSSGMRVNYLTVEVEVVEPQTGASRGRYKGSRRFAVRISGVQDTELTEQQVEMVRKMGNN